MDEQAIAAVVSVLAQRRTFECARMIRGVKDEDGADDGNREITFIASNEKLDSHGTRILQKGWDFSAFRGAFLAFHDNSRPPIGKIVKKWVANHEDTKSLFIRVRFHTAELEPEAERIFQHYQADSMTSVSVGFRPLEVDWPRNEADVERLGVPLWGAVIKRAMLYEVSAVTVASGNGTDMVEDDSRALTNALRSGLLTARQVEAYQRAIRPTGLTESVMTDLLSAVQELRSSMQDADRGIGAVATAAPDDSSEEPEAEPEAGLLAAVRQLCTQTNRELSDSHRTGRSAG